MKCLGTIPEVADELLIWVRIALMLFLVEKTRRRMDMAESAAQSHTKGGRDTPLSIMRKSSRVANCSHGPVVKYLRSTSTED